MPQNDPGHSFEIEAGYTPDGKKRYVLPDHKGSVHLVLNESGDVNFSV